MTVTLDHVKLELGALGRVFYFHERNSDPEKMILYVGLALASIIILGVAFGMVDYEGLPKEIQYIITAFLGTILYTFGRVHGRELEIGKTLPK